ERQLTSRVRPHALGHRTDHSRRAAATRTSVAVREHDLARSVDLALPVRFEMQAQQIALRLDLEHTRPLTHLGTRGCLEPREVSGPVEPRDPVELVERLGSVQRLEPRAETERRVAAFGPLHRLRRAQLMHTRDVAPDAGFARRGAIDDRDLTDGL